MPTDDKELKRAIERAEKASFHTSVAEFNRVIEKISEKLKEVEISQDCKSWLIERRDMLTKLRDRQVRTSSFPGSTTT